MDRHMGLLAKALRVFPKLVGAECGWQQISNFVMSRSDKQVKRQFMTTLDYV